MTPASWVTNLRPSAAVTVAVTPSTGLTATSDTGWPTLRRCQRTAIGRHEYQFVIPDQPDDVRGGRAPPPEWRSAARSPEPSTSRRRRSCVQRRPSAGRARRIVDSGEATSRSAAAPAFLKSSFAVAGGAANASARCRSARISS